MATQAKRRSKKRRRPGYPRKQKVVNRITLRIDRALYDELNRACDQDDVSQRDFVEAALADELRKPPADEWPQPSGDVARTGMWIDPHIVAAMDKRIDQTGVSQRALIEGALRRALQRRRA